MNSNAEFSELSKNLTKSINLTTKKKEGIYFTPQTIINNTLKRIQLENIQIKDILEPSCGTCEFINAIDASFNNTHITGVELNEQIYDTIKNKTLNNNGIEILQEDFLQWQPENKKYDLIIGNPPYFVMKKINVDERFHEFIDGRPNIFILFIIHSLRFLNKDGILAFVLPTNFVNCLYYSAIRHHIYNNYKIIDILHCDKNLFMNTAQDTIIFIIQNKPPDEHHNDQFTINRSTEVFFNSIENTRKLKELYNHSTTLSKMGFDVSVGTVVWNQHKDILSTDNSNTRLIYSGDIKDNALILTKYKDPLKKNYIKKEGIIEPTLALNRGYGKGKYTFSYCIIDQKTPYLLENHLICIKPTGQMAKRTLLKKYRDIIKSFNSDKTKEFIELYFGNNAINTTELKQIMPIYQVK